MVSCAARETSTLKKQGAQQKTTWQARAQSRCGKIGPTEIPSRCRSAASFAQKAKRTTAECAPT
eukprot:4137106-Lingulodinium_polyedra.AAC.1